MFKDDNSESFGRAAPGGRFDLGGRVVLLTGASKGIGRELVPLLAETGAVVVPTVRTEHDAADLASEAKSRGLAVHPQLLDVRDVASITRAVSDIVAAPAGSTSSSTTPVWVSRAPRSTSPRPIGTR